MPAFSNRPNPQTQENTFSLFSVGNMPALINRPNPQTQENIFSLFSVGNMPEGVD
jgi:hypothetical protein